MYIHVTYMIYFFFLGTYYELAFSFIWHLVLIVWRTVCENHIYHVTTQFNTHIYTLYICGPLVVWL